MQNDNFEHFLSTLSTLSTLPSNSVGALVWEEIAHFANEIHNYSVDFPSFKVEEFYTFM